MYSSFGSHPAVTDLEAWLIAASDSRGPRVGVSVKGGRWTVDCGLDRGLVDWYVGGST
jgi:hypothetical protein